MRNSIIPHDAFVFVGDGRRALFLRNEGDGMSANLVAEQGFADDAGREQSSAFFDERHFAERVSKTLEQLARERKAPALAIAAPARTLDDLRAALAPDVKAKVVVEIDKDLTRVPVWAIEKHFVDALAAPRGRR